MDEMEAVAAIKRYADLPAEQQADPAEQSDRLEAWRVLGGFLDWDEAMHEAIDNDPWSLQ